MVWESGYALSIGGRTTQQDNVITFMTPDHSQMLLALADGMGGHGMGELASRALAVSVTEVWQLRDTMTPGALIDVICRAAHLAIVNEYGSGKTSPRTTCAILYSSGGKVYLGHVGDSRIYHFRNDECLMRTSDHSVVQMLVDIGRVKEEDMGSHPDQGRLLKSIGGDTYEAPDIIENEVLSSDSFLLCSDGVWENLPIEKLQQASTFPEPEQAANWLVEAAVQAGGQNSDNAACVIARYL